MILKFVFKAVIILTCIQWCIFTPASLLQICWHIKLILHLSCFWKVRLKCTLLLHCFVSQYLFLFTPLSLLLCYLNCILFQVNTWWTSVAATTIPWVQWGILWSGLACCFLYIRLKRIAVFTLVYFFHFANGLVTLVINPINIKKWVLGADAIYILLWQAKLILIVLPSIAQFNDGSGLNRFIDTFLIWISWAALLPNKWRLDTHSFVSFDTKDGHENEFDVSYLSDFRYCWCITTYLYIVRNLCLAFLQEFPDAVGQLSFFTYTKAIRVEVHAVLEAAQLLHQLIIHILIYFNGYFLLV